MPDFDAIGTALAARFAPAQVTPPAGYVNIRVSTADPPNQMRPLPAVIVFPESGVFTGEGGGKRQGQQTWVVRFYYGDNMDLVRNGPALRKWLTVLVDQLRDSVHLSGGATLARVEGWDIRVLDYADKKYAGIELTVGVTVHESWPATG